jgi:hypothetical protein
MISHIRKIDRQFSHQFILLAILMAKYIKLHHNADVNEVPSIKEWNIGDVMALSDYRQTHTFIIGPDYKPIMNPDLSGSGYLSIPLIVTKLFDNPITHYDQIIKDDDTSSISLVVLPNCSFIKEKYGRSFPEDWSIILWYSDGRLDFLEIGTSKISGTRTFNEDDAWKEIEEALCQDN